MARSVLAHAAIAAALLTAPRLEPARAQTNACPKGLKAQTVAELIFGRNIGEIEGAVDDEEWQRFLDEVVTPRFPSGFSVLDAAGQWWNPPAGKIEREPSKVMLIILERESEQRPRLAEVASLYKRRFSQQSVIIMTRRACVTF